MKRCRPFCQLDPALEKCVTIKNNKRVLYVELYKALYECIQSALLWYDLYISTLQDMGFELNPHNMCVINSMIDRKQCTMCWYVEDNKISHKDPKVVDKIIKRIESKFEKMTSTRGRHGFLGMNIKVNDKRLKSTIRNTSRKLLKPLKMS